MSDFRERTGGDFYLVESEHWGTPGGDTLPLLRFIQAQGGVALDLWGASSADVEAEDMLMRAGLDWEVDSRPVLAPDEGSPVRVPGYQVLVRPDTGQFMSVVTTAFRVAENRWVARAALELGRTLNPQAFLVGAAGFGKAADRTLFVVSVAAGRGMALMLLAYNSHSAGAVQFQLVEADRALACLLVLDVPQASLSVPHVGDVQQRLRDLRHRTMVRDYAEYRDRVWVELSDALWTPRHTAALLAKLWPKEVEPPRLVGGGVRLVHPGAHLTGRLRDCTDAATAFRRICQYLDNESEARERGDFTKDRDERLALGAGHHHKRRAWNWIIRNT